MHAHTVQKILLPIGVGLLALEIPWFVVTQLLVSHSQVKTTATVIRLDHSDANCTGDAIYGYDRTCDHSDVIYPVYAYRDSTGKRHIQDDRYFGAFKQNNPLGKIFRKKVGDTVTAYYSKNNPGSALFMASTL